MQDAGISSCMSNFSVVDPSILFLFFCAGDELIIDAGVITSTQKRVPLVAFCLFVCSLLGRKLRKLIIYLLITDSGPRVWMMLCRAFSGPTFQTK